LESLVDLVEGYLREVLREKLKRNPLEEDPREWVRNLFRQLNLWERNTRLFLVPVLRLNWQEVEEYLLDVEKLAEELVRREPSLKEVLENPKAREWLNEAVEEAYNILYRYTWETT